METLYTATVSNVGGREGDVKSTDGILDLPLTRPVEMHGKGGAANPEMLFAAAYSACYNGALMAVAKHRNVILPEHAVEVSISLNQDGTNMFLSAKSRLKPLIWTTTSSNNWPKVRMPFARIPKL